MTPPVEQHTGAVYVDESMLRAEQSIWNRVAQQISVESPRRVTATPFFSARQEQKSSDDNLLPVLELDGGQVRHAVDREIKWHEQKKQSRSFLGKGFDFIWWQDARSLDNLKSMQTALHNNPESAAKLGEKAFQQIERDRAAVYVKDEIHQYGTGFLKTMFLFFDGNTGAIGTVAAFSLDKMNAGKTLGENVVDGSLGAAQGALMKQTFSAFGDPSNSMDLATKAMALGISSRVLDTGLSRESYFNPATGRYSLRTGLSSTLYSAVAPGALATDVITFGLAKGVLDSTQAIAGTDLSKNPLAARMMTGAAFGISSGATGEMFRQQANGEPLDVSKILQRAAINGAVDGLAAAPSGIQGLLAQRRTETTVTTNPEEGLRFSESQEYKQQFEAAIKAARDVASKHIGNKKAVIVLDIDETLLDNRELYRTHPQDPSSKFDSWASEGRAPRLPLTADFAQWAKQKGFTIILITGRSEALLPATVANLARHEIPYDELIVKRQKMNTGLAKIEARRAIEARGLEIILNIGDQYSDVQGGHATHHIKLPNRMYEIK